VKDLFNESGEIIGLCNGAFDVHSLKIEKNENCCFPPKTAFSFAPSSNYIYDERIGRKRRHDPWFAAYGKISSETILPLMSKKLCKARKVSINSNLRRSSYSNGNKIYSEEIIDSLSEKVDLREVSKELSPIENLIEERENFTYPLHEGLTETNQLLNMHDMQTKESIPTAEHMVSNNATGQNGDLDESDESISIQWPIGDDINDFFLPVERALVSEDELFDTANSFETSALSPDGYERNGFLDDRLVQEGNELMQSTEPLRSIWDEEEHPLAVGNMGFLAQLLEIDNCFL